jgi:hypothetical protein
VTDQLLSVFKFALLALLYLFFARVLWAVWSEVRGPRPAKRDAPRAAMARSAASGGVPTPTDPTVSAAAPVPRAVPASRRAPKGKRGAVGRLVIIQPRANKGAAFAVGPEITVGRAPNCSVSMPDDTFASQLHARVFVRDRAVWLEDLDSTNGTFVNGRRITTVEQLAKGDRIQIGNTILEAE